jgi:hypothetical protein
MIKALHDPILEDGIAFTSYFNGRLLSGEDLARDQQGNREARKRLGQALGDGIAFGLEVFESPGESTKGAPVVTVEPGLAISRLGKTLALGRPVELRLVRGASGVSGAATSAATSFRVCEPQQPGVFVVGEGIYVLAMSCADAGQGRAPVSGLGVGAAACSVRSVVEGVQFRLVQPALSPDLLADLPHLRNRIAGAALGITERFAPYVDPMAPRPTGYSLIDGLRASGILDDSDVPLALLHWAAGTGVTFVDLWSVRRRITPRDANSSWRWLLAERTHVEAEAMFLQFQEQIDDLAASGEDVSRIVATDRFEYLPPLGMLPLQLGSRPGFDLARFFGADRLPRDIAYTDGQQLRWLMREAMSHDPLLLSAQQRLQLYLVFENMQASTSGRAVTPVVVFASGTLPYRGVARYGVARWEQGRFAPRVV